jgi:hypothetical protein
MRPSRRSWSIAYLTIVVTVVAWSHAALPLSASTRDRAQDPKPPASEFHGWQTETYGPVAVVFDDASSSGARPPLEGCFSAGRWPPMPPTG